MASSRSLTRAQWLVDRRAELLPVEYFHVAFTLPQSIQAIAYQNKTLLYDMLFKATAQTLRTIAADPKHLGAEIGFIAVLHTWGQNLLHHPHLHCVVPGGGISLDGKRWIACRPGFFLPVRVLSRLCRYTHRVAISNSRYGHQPSLVTGGFQAPCSSRLLTTALTCAAT